jgi:hypothetical protein
MESCRDSAGWQKSNLPLSDTLYAPARGEAPAASKQAQSKKEKGPVIAEVQHYSVDYAIAAPQLQFSVEGDAHHGVFDFMASTFDDDGKALSRTASHIVADLKPQSFHDVMAGGFRGHQKLAIAVTATSLRLGIEDELNRKLGTVEIPLPVPPPPNEPSAAKARSLPEIEPDYSCMSGHSSRWKHPGPSTAPATAVRRGSDQ